jgi:hypothetical protein
MADGWEPARAWKRRLAGRENTFVAGADGEWLDFTHYFRQWPGNSDVVSLRNPAPPAEHRRRSLWQRCQWM